jgi:hypothetical protein
MRQSTTQNPPCHANDCLGRERAKLDLISVGRPFGFVVFLTRHDPITM